MTGWFVHLVVLRGEAGVTRRKTSIQQPIPYNPHMGLHNIDFTSAFRRLAERRIEEAMKEGKFENLAGAGKPLELEPMPAEENARLTWWALRILKQNDVVPDEVRWRKEIDGLKAELAQVTSRAKVVLLVGRINRLVHRVNTLGTNALNSPVAEVSLEAALAAVASGEEDG